MRNQDTNPAYRKFGHLLPPSGLYPARWVDIFSNTDSRYKYNEVEVVFVPRGVLGIVLDREFWDEFADYNSRWLGDLGNSVSGWMEPGGLNPEKVFGGMLVYGFSSQQAFAEAISEFAAIEECDWARELKAGRFPKILNASAEGGKKAAVALQAETHRPWAREMLEALRSEETF